MKYEYYNWQNNDLNLHLVRVDVLFGSAANGAIFQNELKKEVGEGQIVVLIKDADGIHTTISHVVPLNLTDEDIGKFAWEERTWG